MKKFVFLSFLVLASLATTAQTLPYRPYAEFKGDIGAYAIAMGGHVRVGFEDNLYLSKGVLAKSNGELVDKVVQMAKLLGREIATPAEARRILNLKAL